MLSLFRICLLFSCFDGFVEANPQQSPRMIFTEKDAAVKRLPLPAQRAPVRIFLEEQPDRVTAAGQSSLISFNFQDTMQTPVERKVVWKECVDDGNECNYNISVIHKMKETNHVFLCGSNAKKTICCDMDLTNGTSVVMCNPSKKTNPIQDVINGLEIKEDAPSALVESAEGADLYVAYSGNKDHVGIHKFGENKVRPATNDKALEQHYVSLMPMRLGGTPNQDKVYAFYKEKNKDTKLDGEMWLPFVTRICMTDVGGPKNHLQSSWTSQMNARLFCGDLDRRQHFSELVDVATVEAERWQDTRVYALFRNEWGMSAVCVYTLVDIDNIFSTSPFKGVSTEKRDRMCVTDSKKISLENLKMIKESSEMEQWVRPEDNSRPLLFNHQNYTHISVDRFQPRRNDDLAVLFLSLNDGGVHKVMHTKNQTLVIAEYRPFNHESNIFSMTLHHSSRKLYVSSGSKLVQLDVENCGLYGARCEECVLSRDPYCGWNDTHCSPRRHDIMQNVITGSYTTCPQAVGRASRYSSSGHADKDVKNIRVPAESMYFFQCPVSSHHAQYSWHHNGSSTSCSRQEQNCLHLINGMSPEQEGTYTCVSEEMGYKKVLAQYQVQMMTGAAGRLSGPLLWVCLVLAVLIKSLYC